MFCTRHIMLLGLSGGTKVMLLILVWVGGGGGLDVERGRIENRKTNMRNHTVISGLVSLH